MNGEGPNDDANNVANLPNAKRGEWGTYFEYLGIKYH
jgi:hypothetical protein